MKIAWFTPFSIKSAIGHCSATIVEELAKYASVTVFASDLEDPAEAWLPDFDIQLLKQLPPARVLDILPDYDLAVYNLGDNYEYHSSIFEISSHHPGIVILHDTVMTHFFSGYHFVYREQEQGFIDAMSFSHGAEGKKLAEDIINHRVSGDIWFDPILLRYNMAHAAIRGAYGTIVHSEFAHGVLEQVASAPVKKIHFPFPGRKPHTEQPHEASQTDSSRAIKILTFGVINPNKMVAEVIEAIGQSDTLRQCVEYHVVGTVPDHYDTRLKQLIQRYDLEKQIHLHGYQPDHQLHEHLQTADIVTNLRNPHFGEASWSLLEALFMGKPTVVWAHGYYDEFPDTVVAKVHDTNEITRKLELLCTDATQRRVLGEQGRAYAEATFKTETYVREALAFFNQALYNKPVLDLTDRLSHQIQEIGGAYGFPRLSEIVSQEIEILIATSPSLPKSSGVNETDDHPE